MKPEWPIARPERAAEAEPLLPLDFAERVELIMASPALRAFARFRVGQMLHKGHTSESDLTKGIGQIAREAQWRLSGLHDIVGRDRMNLPPGRRADCMRYIESAGAVLIALWERCQVEVDDGA